MLEYKPPTTSKTNVDASEYKHPPHSSWPTELNKPDFDKWRKFSKKGLTRNLIALLFFYFEISVKEISDFLELSESRVRTIIKTTQKHLFGVRYKTSKEEQDLLFPLYIHNDARMRSYAAKRIAELEGNSRELKAIFHALSIVYWKEFDDIRLCHHALTFLERRLKNIDFHQYE